MSGFGLLDDPAAFRPVPVADIALSEPWREQPPVPNEHGELFLLVRLHERPLASLLLRGVDSARPAASIMEALPEDVLTAVREHLRADGLPATSYQDNPDHDGSEHGTRDRHVGDPPAVLPSTCPRRPDGGNLSVSVIVCTLGREPRLADTIASLLAQDHAPHEVLVVDNDPQTQGVHRLLAGVDDARVVVVPEPRRGLSFARNAGLEAATGQLIAFTDDDAVADPMWLRALAAVFVRHPSVACVTGLVLPAELATPEHVWFEQFGGFAKGFSRSVWRLDDDPSAARIGPLGHRGPVFPYTAGEFGSGNNMAFDADALRSIGGFDAALGAGSRTRGGEDLDAFLRILLGGGTLVYEPSALVRHTHRSDLASLREQLYGYGTGMSAVVAKHLLTSPSNAAQVLQRLPAGLKRLLDPASVKNAGKSADFPPELTRVELKGYAAGPAPLLAQPVGPLPAASPAWVADDAAGERAQGTRVQCPGAHAQYCRHRRDRSVLLGSGRPPLSGRRSRAGVSSDLHGRPAGQLLSFQPGERLHALPAAAGPHIRRLVRQGMALTATTALVVGTVFVLVWPTDTLFASGTERVLFPLCVAVLTVFTVQDAVLLGLRTAAWIPVKSLVFSVVKLALLIGLASVLPQGGLVLAWVAPAAVAVGVVVWLLHRTVMPRQMAAAGPRHDLPRPRALAGYAAGEYTTGLMAYLVPLALPLIIVAKLGTEQNAYFAVPWVISTALNMLIWNIAASLVVEAATDEESTRTLARRSLKLSLVVAGGGAVVLLLGAPLLLRIFGTAYAEQGEDLLRLMALAAPATAVTTLYTSVARVRRQVGRVVAVQAAIAVLISALTLLLTDDLGVTGVGIAYLVAEGLVGLLLLFPLMRALRAHQPKGVASPPLVGAPGTGYADAH